MIRELPPGAHSPGICCRRVDEKEFLVQVPYKRKITKQDIGAIAEHAAECLSGFVGQELEVGKSSKRGVRIDGKYFGKHRLPHYSLSTGLVLTEDGIAAHTVFIKKRYFMPDRDGTILQALKKYALACNPDLSL